MTLQDLSIADCKASLDFLQEILKERKDDLKSQGEDPEKNIGFKKLEKLNFEIRNSLFIRLQKLKHTIE